MFGVIYLTMNYGKNNIAVNNGPGNNIEQREMPNGNINNNMSGDASVGNGEFTSKNSNITTNKGDTFYVTNTSCVINLENNKIVNNDTTGDFLRVKSDSWGNSGSNWGEVVLNATN